MAMSINTNITSMIGQQNLSESKSALTTSMERLSSGLRINSAKDDAAGQAIANRMSSQITGLSQAQRNANDGISVAQTAEGALNQVNDNLQRIRELSVQAQNGTNNQEDLTSIQNEIGQRLNEINRISEETSFNGTKVLDSDQTLSIQVGANDGESISISLSQINAETLGLSGFNVTGEGEIDNAAATEDDLKLAENVSVSGGAGDYTLEEENTSIDSDQFFKLLDDGATVSLSSTNSTGLQDESDAAIDYASLGNLAYSKANDNFTFDATLNSGSAKDKILPSAAEGSRTADITVGGTKTSVVIDSNGDIANTDGESLYFDDQGNVTTTSTGTTADATVDNLTALMSSDNTGTTAGLDMTGGASTFSTMSIELSDGSSYTGTGTATEINAADVTMSRDNVQNILSNGGGQVTLSSAISVDAGTEDTFDFDVSGSDLEIQESTGGSALRFSDADDIAGSLTANQNTETELYVRDENDGAITDSNGVQYFVDQEGSLTTESVTKAERSSLSDLDSALSQVDALRSDLGAIQNRFDSAITNLSTTETNLSAARSRIEDADYATEVADMTKNQILQQAGTSVLAQANQLPQSVLSLLG